MKKLLIKKDVINNYKNMCPSDYKKVALNAFDVIKRFEEERRNISMIGYNIEEIKSLANYVKKINKKIQDNEKNGIDWYDAYKLKKWTNNMHNIMDGAHMRYLLHDN